MGIKLSRLKCAFLATKASISPSFAPNWKAQIFKHHWLHTARARLLILFCKLREQNIFCITILCTVPPYKRRVKKHPSPLTFFSLYHLKIASGNKKTVPLTTLTIIKSAKIIGMIETTIFHPSLSST